ncbi:hypothetical protein [Rhizobium sp. SYY.PMSO]
MSDTEKLGPNRAGRALLIFSLQIVVACDGVSVLIDHLSPTSLY